MITRHTLAASIVTPANVPALSPVRAIVSRDEDWAPYIQADLTIVTPRDTTLPLLDPRSKPAPRVKLDLSRDAGAGALNAAAVTVRSAGRVAALTASQGTRPLSAVSRDYGGSWNDAAIPNQYATVVAWVRQRKVDLETGRTQLTLTSGEVLLQDYCLVASAPWRPPGTNVRDIVDRVLARIGHMLAPADADLAEVAYESTVWEPGVSAWDYLTPLLQVANRRLYCDEIGAWRLEVRQAIKPGNLELRVGVDAIVSATEGTDREDGWADAVVVKYTWKDFQGEDRIAYDLAQDSPVVTRVLAVEYEMPYPGAGAAKRLLRRAITRGRGFEASIVSDYYAEPGQTVTLESPSGPPTVGYLSRTIWSWPEARTSLVTRAVRAVSPNAWVYIPEGLSWNDIPAGVSWRELDQIIPDLTSQYAWSRLPLGLAWKDIAPGVSWRNLDQLFTQEE